MYWIYRSANSSPFLMHEKENQHPFAPSTVNPPLLEKGRRKKERGRKKLKRGKKNRGRKSEKSDGDRWANRQVRKVRREE